MKRARPDRYFSADSVLHQMHRERIVGLMYGQRALAIGAAHPLNYTATAIHSTGRLRPFARLARTASVLEAIILGDSQEADKALARVTAIHHTVNGELPCDAAQYPAGTPYSAFEPQLMLWTIAVMADSAVFLFELLVRSLTSDEKEIAWQDYRRLGKLFLLSLSDTPETYSEFRRWWEDRMSSGDLQLTPEARQTGYSVAFEIPVPKYAARFRRQHNAIMLGSLPSQIRNLYGLRYTAEDEARFTAEVEKVRQRRKRSLRWLAQGRNGLFFRWVTRTERLRLERGQPTLQLAMPASDENRDIPVT